MSDAEYLFRESLKEKKGMLNGARHTKGKTKRNGTPKDLDVSAKEYKQRCGQVEKFSINMPMNIDKYNELPGDLQKEYLERLINIFGMNKAIIAKMFGTTSASVSTIMKIAGVKVTTKPGRVPEKIYNTWNQFFSRDEAFSYLIHKKEEKTASTKEEEKVEEAKKTPEVISMAIRIYANSYDELISQLESMRGQPIMGKVMTIEVVKE